MSPLTVVIGAFILALVAFGFAWGAPILAVPIVVLGIAALGALDLRRRRKQAKQMHEFRQEAEAQQVDFTERDKRTLVSE